MAKNNNQKIRMKNQSQSITSKLKEYEVGLQGNVFVYTEPLTIKDFATKIKQPLPKIIKHFMMKKMVVNPNTVLNEEQIGELSLELGFDFEHKTNITFSNLLEEMSSTDKSKNPKLKLKRRPPIVTIMGHVDHGKTTLLEHYRKINILGHEHGGITQHIGAYSVEIDKKQTITFIDTPGHEAFTQMRVRGSKFTDIIVLIVAADDGVMPQTKEAIGHAKAAKVPIIVFINKMDKPNANADLVLSGLAQEGLVPEAWGGDVPVIKGSALKNQNLDELLTTINLIAELLDLKADFDSYASGVVLEAKLDKKIGPCATLLVQNGTLHKKDIVVVGDSVGYIRSICNDRLTVIDKATPGHAVQVQGLDKVPSAGDKFLVFGEEKLAREVAVKRKQANIMLQRQAKINVGFKTFSAKIKEGQLKKLNLILKTDTRGSLEALVSSIEKIKIEKIKINIIYKNIGGISDSDISLANASQAVVIGFNVGCNSHVRHKAKNEGIDINLYNVIYQLLQDLEETAKGILEPNKVEVVQSHLKVKQLFHHSVIGTIAGCEVIDGIIKRNHKVKLYRNEVLIYDGEIASLKHNKDDVREARKGLECGLLIKNFNDIKEDDIIESYVIEVKNN